MLNINSNKSKIESYGYENAIPEKNSHIENRESHNSGNGYNI